MSGILSGRSQASRHCRVGRAWKEERVLRSPSRPRLWGAWRAKRNHQDPYPFYQQSKSFLLYFIVQDWVILCPLAAREAGRKCISLFSLCGRSKKEPHEQHCKIDGRLIWYTYDFSIRKGSKIYIYIYKCQKRRSTMDTVACEGNPWYHK